MQQGSRATAASRVASMQAEGWAHCGTGDVVARLTRMDMHCHSHASNKPVNRIVGALTRMPECYTTPEQVYDQARARGMDLVTITDHDTIDGGMELSRRGFQGFVLGQEITARFPEDGCIVHVLVWGLTPELAEDIDKQRLRADVYMLAQWIRHHNLAHALAHPVYIQNGRLRLRHLEIATLLFKGWEVLNGAHSVTHRATIERYLAALTPAKVQALSAQHGVRPLWPRVWHKAHTAGSDDHARLNIGRTWTGVPVLAQDRGAKLTNPQEFLRRVMACHDVVGGVGGHAALLAHQLSTVAAHWYAKREPKGSATGRYIKAKMLELAGVEARKPHKVVLAASHAGKRVLERVGARKRRGLPLVGALQRTIGQVLERHPSIAMKMREPTGAVCPALGEHEAMAAFFDDLSATLTRSLAGTGTEAWRRRSRDDVLRHLLSGLVLQAAQAPYIFSLFHQNKERRMLDGLDRAHVSGDEATPLGRPMRVLQFTDTLGDVNGVSRFIQNLARLAHENKRALTVVTSTRFACPALPTIRNFEPVLSVPMPKYAQLDVVVPPLLPMLRFADQLQPDVVHVSTPGPVGVIGWIAARMLRVPIVGTYHTDFPSYIDTLFDDHGFTKLCELYMKWFYRGFSRVFSRSDQFLEEMRRVGIGDQKMLTLRSGIETRDFGERYHDRGIWQSLGIDKAHDPDGRRLKALYVGRVSEEKNLPLLTQVWKRVRRQCAARGLPAELIVVGDGPYRPKMEIALRGEGAHMLGFKHGEELAAIYASSDLFLFPSTTDTLGQSVMEAQASGVPALVSDQGGPKSIVRDGASGFVLRGDDVEGWVQAALRVLTDDEERRRLRIGAVEAMRGRDIRDSFEHYWQEHEAVWREAVVGAGDNLPMPERSPARHRPARSEELAQQRA